MGVDDAFRRQVLALKVEAARPWLESIPSILVQLLRGLLSAIERTFVIVGSILAREIGCWVVIVGGLAARNALGPSGPVPYSWRWRPG